MLATLLRPITYYERLYAAELSEIDSLEDFDADPSVESLEENSKSGAQEETTRFLNSPEVSFNLNSAAIFLRELKSVGSGPPLCPFLDGCTILNGEPKCVQILGNRF